MALKDLVVNSGEIEEEALEGVLKDYFKYDQTGGILFTNRAFWKLPGDKKVALFLAGLLGRKFLEVEGIELSAANEEIARKLNMNESSVRVYISLLRKTGSVVTDKDKHSVTTQGIHDLMEEEK